ncbi:MAG: response regulator [Alphaproteobacteria bacterium]|nr:response regulator [Alphaproteobacteria bacterium]
MPTNPKTILIVEDNELNAKLFRDLLSSKGHRILETREGSEAIRITQTERPDLILMDIQLPEISGFDIIRMMKDDSSLLSIPIIAITAFAMKGDEEKIRLSGCDDYLSKPISVGKFFETVQKYLG